MPWLRGRGAAPALMPTSAQATHRSMDDAPTQTAGGVGPIVLFDGLCVFCDGSMRLLMRLDRRGRLRFAPLQSPVGRALVEAYGVPDSVDSVVLVDRGRALVHSSAALGITRQLGLPWSLAMAFWMVPTPIRDWAYRLFARHRYRMFGRREACRVPTPAQRGRLMERVEDAGGVLAAAPSISMSSESVGSVV